MTKSAKSRPTKRAKVVSPILQTDKKELENETERVKREADEVGEYVDERRDSIRRGARRSKHRFRI